MQIPLWKCYFNTEFAKSAAQFKAHIRCAGIIAVNMYPEAQPKYESAVSIFARSYFSSLRAFSNDTLSDSKGAVPVWLSVSAASTVRINNDNEMKRNKVYEIFITSLM